MSIASELNNYRNGLDDAWDAAEDMGATIPHDRNMVNLDDAIRTIPVSSPNDGVLTIQQNGTTLGTFTADQATNTTVNITASTTTTFYWRYNSGTSTYNLYKQIYPTYVVATGSDVWTAFSNGALLISDDTVPFSDNLTYIVTSWDDDCNRLGAVTTKEDYSNTIPYYIGMVWDSDTQTWTKDVSKLTYTAGTNVSIDAQNVISATDTTYSNFVGATSSVAGSAGLVPAPTTSDPGKFLKGDGTWAKPDAELVEMYYGESNAWAKFIDAYTRKCIVYCRASSNANPGSGAKTRKAFMAYVNNEDNPTSVEFQYVRSVSSKTDSQQCDQVFVYTLTNASGGTWSVASRNMAPKINVDSTLTKTFSTGANATVTLKANAMTGATGSAAGTAGYVPAPAAGDQDKLLKGDGTWAAPTSATASDYLSFSSGFTVNTLDATKMGPFVKVHFDISGTISNGENVVGTATAKVGETSYGACRVTGGAQMVGASAVVIPSGAVRIYSSESGTGSAGDVWFFEA